MSQIQAAAPVRAEVRRVEQMKVFFGHQSVGMNLLEGLREVAKAEGSAVQVVDLGAGAIGPGMIAHAYIGENGDPKGKVAAFGKKLESVGGQVDVALMKLCYVDFDATTDVDSIFSAYEAEVARLRERFPRTTFVHVTAPLTTVRSGLKEQFKSLLGKEPYGLAENANRERYNALMRQKFEGKQPLFDIARIESTAPDGSAVTMDRKGAPVRVLASAYTDDGGHLNAAGRDTVARAFVRFLAALPQADAPRAEN